MEENKNLYEGMFIISATLSNEARAKALDRVQMSITNRGGKVVKIHDMGKRRLAYEIGKHREGYYYTLYFEVKPEAIAEMWEDYHLNEDLVRFMTLRAEEILESLEFKPLIEVA